MAARIPNYQGAPDGVHLYTPGAMWNLLLWKKTQVISAIYSFIGAHLMFVYTSLTFCDERIAFSLQISIRSVTVR